MAPAGGHTGSLAWVVKHLCCIRQASCTCTNLPLACGCPPSAAQVEAVPEDQRELEQAGALHAHCLQVSEEPNNVRPPFEGTCAALCCAAW